MPTRFVKLKRRLNDIYANTTGQRPWKRLKKLWNPGYTYMTPGWRRQGLSGILGLEVYYSRRPSSGWVGKEVKTPESGNFAQGKSPFSR